jgi:hypothetical protein
MSFLKSNVYMLPLKKGIGIFTSVLKTDFETLSIFFGP